MTLGPYEKFCRSIAKRIDAGQGGCLDGESLSFQLGFAAGVQPREYVFVDGEVGHEPSVLKAATNPVFRDPVATPSIDVRPPNNDAPPVGSQQARYAVDQRCFPRAVGADDPVDRITFNRQVGAVERSYGVKRFSERDDLDRRHADTIRGSRSPDKRYNRVGGWTGELFFIMVSTGVLVAMLLDWNNLSANLRFGITRRSGAFFELDSRRFKSLVGSALLFAYGWLSFVFFATLDRVFFPAFRRVPIRQPLFVIGNFRSGTSLVYNMLSAASTEVSSFKTWQIYLAPTISQRKLVRFASMADHALLSGRGERGLRALNERFLRTVPVHPIDLFSPEEDAGVLMFAWTGFFTWFLFPRRDASSRFVRFDELNRRYRHRIVRFYRSLVQRHLYDASIGGRRPVPTFVSKNPTFTGMVRTIREVFPDSRFLYMMRGPDETYRSTMDWFGFWAGRVGDRAARVDPERVREMMRHWYRYPPTVFETLDPAGWAIISLERLIAAPDRMLILLGRRLLLPWLEQPHNRRLALVAMHRNYGSRYGVPVTIAQTIGEPEPTDVNRFVAALVAAESAASVIRRFQTDLRRGIALALRVD